MRSRVHQFDLPENVAGLLIIGRFDAIGDTVERGFHLVLYLSLQLLQIVARNSAFKRGLKAGLKNCQCLFDAVDAVDPVFPVASALKFDLLAN